MVIRIIIRISPLECNACSEPLQGSVAIIVGKFCRSAVGPCNLAIVKTTLLSCKNMAALYEGYTLCGFVPLQNTSNLAIQGVELYGDVDHVLVTDSLRSATVYKVN